MRREPRGRVYYCSRTIPPFSRDDHWGAWVIDDDDRIDTHGRSRRFCDRNTNIYPHVRARRYCISTRILFSAEASNVWHSHAHCLPVYLFTSPVRTRGVRMTRARARPPQRRVHRVRRATTCPGKKKKKNTRLRRACRGGCNRPPDLWVDDEIKTIL